MRDDLETLVNRVAATLPAVDWAPPEEIRRNAYAYRRRRIFVASIALPLGLGGGGGAAWSALVDDPPAALLTHNGAATVTCPDGMIPVSVALPDEPQIRLRVFNASSRPGLARYAATELELRGFKVESSEDTWDAAGVPGRAAAEPYAYEVDATGRYYAEKGAAGGEYVALIRYGPSTVGAAWVVRAYFSNQALAQFDPDHASDAVDVMLGDGYVSIPSRPEVNRYIAVLGPARPPVGTCAIEDLVR